MMVPNELTNDLNTALNESTVAGVHLDTATATVRILLHVLALPDDGPIDPDPRRALILSGVSDFRVLLRPDRTGHAGYGPAIPLQELGELTAVFGSLTINQPMYGWKFLDDPDLIADWPSTAAAAQADWSGDALPRAPSRSCRLCPGRWRTGAKS